MILPFGASKKLLGACFERLGIGTKGARSLFSLSFSFSSVFSSRLSTLTLFSTLPVFTEQTNYYNMLSINKIALALFAASLVSAAPVPDTETNALRFARGL